MMSERTCVAVTGAGGFLGQVLVRQLLDQGVSVRAVSRRPLESSPGVSAVQSDIRDVARLESAFKATSTIFHLAAHVHDLTSSDDSALQQAITLGGTLAVLEAAQRAGVGQVILASSLAVFGDVGDACANEDHPCRPNTPYGQAKLEAEEALRDFSARTGALSAAIRPAMMYGVPCPGNLPRMIRAVASGWFPPIPEFGNRRSMISVDDAAMAMRLAWRAEVPNGRAYIVTDGEAYSTRQVYDLIRESMGKTSKLPRIPNVLFPLAAQFGDFLRQVLRRRLAFDSQALSRLTDSAYFDSTRARVELGFTANSTLRDSIADLVRCELRKGRSPPRSH